MAVSGEGVPQTVPVHSRALVGTNPIEVQEEGCQDVAAHAGHELRHGRADAGEQAHEGRGGVHNVKHGSAHGLHAHTHTHAHAHAHAHPRGHAVTQAGTRTLFPHDSSMPIMVLTWWFCAGAQ